MRRENQYAAQLEREQTLQLPVTVFDGLQYSPNSVDGRLISQVTGIGSNPRSAKINAIIQLEDAEPAILVSSMLLVSKKSYSLRILLDHWIERGSSKSMLFKCICA